NPKQWPRLLELLPALLHPLPDELEQRRRMHQKPLLGDQNFASTIGSMLLSAFLEPSIDEYTCTGVREMARRLTASADSSTARDCFTFFVVEQLMKFVVDVVQNVHEHAVDQQFNLKRLGRLAELLQDVGALAVDNISAVHERLCHVGMDICRRHLLDHAVLSRALRTFWLLFLTHKNALLKEFAILLMDVLKIAIGDASLFDADEQRWLIDALLCVHFALLNTFGNDGGHGQSYNSYNRRLLNCHHLLSYLIMPLLKRKHSDEGPPLKPLKLCARFLNQQNNKREIRLSELEDDVENRDFDNLSVQDGVAQIVNERPVLENGVTKMNNRRRSDNRISPAISGSWERTSRPAVVNWHQNAGPSSVGWRSAANPPGAAVCWYCGVKGHVAVHCRKMRRKGQ
uniref:CCHC-type domain-containing protein n=1 Tax=Globodera pallida TaxID=36090 RepID=A0A183CFR7_GLOPA